MMWAALLAKLSFFFPKSSKDVAFYRFNLNCCFIFENVVHSYPTPRMRLTHCFHFVTYNKHKVLKLSRRYSWCCFSLCSSRESAFVFVILFAMLVIWLLDMWFQRETSRR